MNNNPLKKIVIILIGIVVLPVLLFTISEVATVNQDEELIREIYENQLESIIYSVNQYSLDLTTNWKTNINIILYSSLAQNKNLRDQMIGFLRDNNSVRKIFYTDVSFDKNIVFESLNDSYRAEVDAVDVINTLEENKSKLSRLTGYQKSGYRKLEPISFVGHPNYVTLIFVTDFDDPKYQLCGIVIDAQSFVSGTLAPKIQEISREDIIISCFNQTTKEIIYTNLPVDVANFQKEGPLWLLPEYQLAISLKGRTIEGLVKQQSITNLILISLITIVLLIGAVFVYRNTRKEIQLAQTKSDFVSNVSHELRTPLALISMFAETLEMGRVKNDEKRQEYYHIISQETNRLSRIVNTILNFSKMEAGKREYKFERNDLNIILSDVLETYKFHLHNKGFNLNHQFAENELLINADKEAVSECLINIIDNAVKYSDDKKEIKIESGVKDGFNFISVTDYGLGIAEEDQKKIFDKFYRVSSGLVHNTKGTGMGLSIVHQIVEAHKGKIEVISKLGSGSTFTLFFPINNEQV